MTLINRRVLRHLVWVCSVCLCATKRTLTRPKQVCASVHSSQNFPARIHKVPYWMVHKSWGPPRGGGGGYLFPCSPEINWHVPLFPKIENLFSYVPCSPILSLFPCSPQNLAFVPLFPWNKCPVSPVPQNPWEGLRAECIYNGHTLPMENSSFASFFLMLYGLSNVSVHLNGWPLLRTGLPSVWTISNLLVLCWMAFSLMWTLMWVTFRSPASAGGSIEK